MLYIDYLKFIAIFAVIAFHIHETITYSSNWFSGGYLGVDIFLFISGYLIERSLRSSGAGFLESASNFFKRRLSRIAIPMLVITWIVAIFGYVLQLSGWEPAIYSSLFIYNFYLVFHHIPYFQTFALPHPFIGMWFIALLVQLYIAHFLIRKAIVNRIVYFVVMLLLMLVAVGGAYWLGMHHHLNQSYVLPWHGFSYIAGILWFSLFHASAPKKSSVFYDLAVALSTALMIALLIWAPYQNYVIYSLPILLLTGIYFFAAERSHFYSQWKWGLGGVLGEMSYSLYLWNFPVVSIIYHFYSEAPGYVLVLLSLLIILLLSVLSYYLVEVQIQRAFSKQSRHPFSAQTAGVAVLLLGLAAAGWYNSLLMNQAFIHERQKNLHLILYKQYQEQKIARLLGIVHSDKKTLNLALGQNAGNATAPFAATASTESASLDWQPYPQPGYEYNGQGIRENAAYPNKQVLVITDSILLGWSGYVIHQLPNAILNGKVGRQFSRAVAILPEELAKPQNADVQYVVLELGSNGDVFRQNLDQVIREAGNRKVLLIVPNVPRVWENEVKAQYREAKSKYPNVYLLHWNRISHDQYNYFVADQVHLTWDGAQALVNALSAKLYTMGYRQPPKLALPPQIRNKAFATLPVSVTSATASTASVPSQGPQQSPHATLITTTNVGAFPVAPLQSSTALSDSRAAATRSAAQAVTAPGSPPD